MSKKTPSQWLIAQNSFNQSFTDEPEEKKSAIKIAVTSGKGGVGKTSVAIKISKMLATFGKKVLLVDCDHNLSNTSVKLGLPLNDNFMSLITSKKSWDDCLYKDGNFHLLSGCNGNLELYDFGEGIDKFVIDIVSEHEDEYDYIMMDCSAGLGKGTLNIAAYADHRLFVINPDPSSLTDSYGLIKLLKIRHGIQENLILFNRVDSFNQYKKIVRALGETIESFIGGRISVLGSVENRVGASDDFDKVLLKSADTKLHQNFLKVLKRLTEIDGSSSNGKGRSRPPISKINGLGQDVPTIVGQGV